MKDKIPLVSFIFSLMLFSFLYGSSAVLFRLFPYPQFASAVKDIRAYLNTWYYVQSENPRVQTVYDSQRTHPGLSLVTGMGADRVMFAQIVDMDGTVLHRWEVDWFEVWPDAEHLRGREIPKSRPGTHIHGALLTSEGDLVFNFEHKGLVRIAKDGRILWKLPYQTHHSICMDDNGNLWVPGEIFHYDASLPGFPNYKPTFREYTLLKVSMNGEILEEISLFDILKDNGLYGLLTMSATTAHQTNTYVTGDTLHLNDVDIYPRSLEEGFFRHGDIMVSLRNVNTVFVMTPERHIKYISVGKYVRQHDPDFIDGTTISVYDNNNIKGAPQPYSRIVLEHVPSGEVEVVFKGTESMPFFSDMMGKHQWLPNGNLLITESRGGRAFEVTPDGDMVWDFYNVVGVDTVGVVSEVTRLPAHFDAVFR